MSSALDWFLPTTLAAGEDGARARVAVATSLLMALVFCVLASAHFAAARGREAIVNVALAAVCAASPFALRRTGRYVLLVNATIAAVMAGITMVALSERGAGINAATVALAEIPLFATLISGIRAGTVWLALSSAVSVAVGVLAHLGGAPRPPAQLFNDHVVLLVVTGTLFLVAVIYERGRARALAQIAELEARRHRAELDRMRATSDARVAQAERLASLGRIAGAVAHEIMNPLAYAQSNVEFASSRLPGGAAELREALEESLDGIRRVGRIVAELDPFTRPRDGAIDCDVVVAVDAAIKMASSHLRSKAAVRVHKGRVPRVRGDADRLAQVFVNLLVNAAQAIAEGRAGDNHVDVRVERRGAEVVVEIEDTGEGIPPDVIQHAMDPAFSAKPTGEGLGLGLAMSHAILESIGGKLEFESRPGRTVARVRLQLAAAAPIEVAEEAKPPDAAPAPIEPAKAAEPIAVPAPIEAVKAAEPPAAPIEAARSAPPSARPQATILLVDDEPMLTRAITRMLRGHRVTAAHSGKEALRLLADGARYDLILCDVMMPELSGMDVYDAVAEAHPELLDRLVFMTGGTFTSRTQEFRETSKSLFLDKPIDAPTLQALVARLRGGGQEGA